MCTRYENIDRASAGKVGRRVNLNLPAGPRGHAVPPPVFVDIYIRPGRSDTS